MGNIFSRFFGSKSDTQNNDVPKSLENILFPKTLSTSVFVKTKQVKAFNLVGDYVGDRPHDFTVQLKAKRTDRAKHFYEVSQIADGKEKPLVLDGKKYTDLSIESVEEIFMRFERNCQTSGYRQSTSLS